MVVIYVYGLDQFVVGDISGEISKNLANLYEVDIDEINFVAVNNMVFHNGVEQTSWHTIIRVVAPEVCHVLQDKIKNYLIECFKDYTINIEIYFEYFHNHDHILHINEDYPRYMSEKNVVEIDDEYDEAEEIFDGNIFEDFNKHFHND